jgi:hypothetical protein
MVPHARLVFRRSPSAIVDLGVGRRETRDASPAGVGGVRAAESG